MATAKKLPSGSYRVRVPSHQDKDGKWIYKSFTAPTKREAEMKAAKFKNEMTRRETQDITVREALEGYVEAKNAVLSPTTVKTHKRYILIYYDDLLPIKLSRLNTESVQLWLSGLTKKVSPKTVKNAYGLLTASLKFYDFDRSFRVTLPKKKKVQKVSPSDGDVQTLLDVADGEMKICIALAAFGGLRRGEVCALKYDCINWETRIIHVKRSMVKNEDNIWVLKTPKTEDGERWVKLPERVMAMLREAEGGEDGRILKLNPNCVTDRFANLRKKANITFRFHDLRHYFASMGAVLGIPDTYLANFGGWTQNSGVMKEVYQNKIVTMEEAYASKMSEYFDGLLKTV